MKKSFLFIMIVLVFSALLLMGCNDGQPSAGPGDDTKEVAETTAPSADDPYAGQFRVGHGRVNITPQVSVPLAGYGNTERRMSTGFLDYIYTTCIAITDENDETLILFTIDLINSYDALTARLKEQVAAAANVPLDHVVVNSTHTHSSVDGTSGLKVVAEWSVEYVQNCVEAARLALADRQPAKMYWTTADLTGYNFVRHYYTDLGEAVGANHERWALGTKVRHTTDAYPIMFLLKFERENAKDVYFANWRAHNVMTSSTSTNGGTTYEKTNISSDYTGQLRANIEKHYDVYFAYFMGDSGNISTVTRLPADIEKNAPTNYKEYGKEVSEIMIKAIDAGWEEIQPGPIQIVSETFTAKTNQAELEHAAEAQAIVTAWRETGDASDAFKKDTVHYIQSQYHASAILARRSYGATGSFPIFACRIGDFAFTQAPFELFDTNGCYVRDNSPTKYTFVMGYSNESHGYLPSAVAFDYGCYESDTAWLARGTAEDLASRFVELLNQLYQK